MKRIMLLMAALGALITTPVLAETYFGFRIGISNAPPPPRVYFREQPDVVFVPQSRVYVVRNADYDMFRYGRYWYVTRGGYWYRARNYAGPFRVVDARRVPRAIYDVPAPQWRHRRWDRDRDGAWDRDRDGAWDRDRDRAGDRDRYGAWDQDRDGARDRDRDGSLDRDDRTYFGFNINIMNAPPPPTIYFREQPEVVFVPETRVYVVQHFDYDMFRYGDSWYVSRDGYWYRSQSYRGPFVAVDARSVPEPIYRVPAQHWKHRRWDTDRDRDRDGDRDRDRDRDRDHDRDRDRDRDHDRDRDRGEGSGGSH